LLPASLGGFLATSGAIVLYWGLGEDSSGCSGDGCALEFAAVLSASIGIGLLVGAVSGFVAYVLTRNTDAPLDD